MNKAAYIAATYIYKEVFGKFPKRLDTKNKAR